MRHYYMNETAPDVERLYRRSRHLYLLLVGLAQGGIGIYIKAFEHTLAYIAQWLATLLMTLGSLALVYAFFYEIPDEIVKTPVSRMAMYMLLASAVLHLGSSLIEKFSQAKK